MNESLQARAEETFECPEKAHRWLHRPCRALYGKPPADVAMNAEGLEEVLAILDRIDHGVFS